MATYSKGITRLAGGRSRWKGGSGSKETESARTFLLVTARGATLSLTPSETIEENETGGLSVKEPSLLLSWPLMGGCQTALFPEARLQIWREPC